MALENIETNKLKTAINSCLQTLNFDSSNNIINSLNGDSIWSGDSKDTLNEALKKIADIKYKELKEKLNSCLVSINSIDEYQNIKKNNNNLLIQKKNKDKELKEEKAKPSPDTTKITNLTKDIKKLVNQIENNKNKMNNIEKNINGGI